MSGARDVPGFACGSPDRSDPAGLRRVCLRPGANPAQAIDYLVEFSGVLPAVTALTVCYVPDKLIVAEADFDAYLAVLGGQDWSSPEALAVAMLGDFNNELVPRWVGVVVERNRHKVVVEDRQPSWDNAALLARLPPV